MSATLAAFLFIGVDDRAPLAGRHRADVIVRVLSPPIIDLIQISSGIEMPVRSSERGLAVRSQRKYGQAVLSVDPSLTVLFGPRRNRRSCYMRHRRRRNALSLPQSKYRNQPFAARLLHRSAVDQRCPLIPSSRDGSHGRTLRVLPGHASRTGLRTPDLSLVAQVKIRPNMPNIPHKQAELAARSLGSLTNRSLSAHESTRRKNPSPTSGERVDSINWTQASDSAAN